MFVKICANTSLEDALLSVDAGADAVGFVFAASKRQVTPEQVAAITRGLPWKILKVGVFDTHDADEIVRAVEVAELMGVQLHGGLDVPLAKTLRSRLGKKTKIIQTLHWVVGGELGPGHAEQAVRDGLLAIAAEKDLMDAVLLDSRLAANAASATTVNSGGTGKTFDWVRAERLIAELAQTGAADAVTEISSSGEMVGLAATGEIHLPHIIVAGGLHPGNVAEAIATLRPYGVDVASGTEAAPGKKDAAKVKAFVSAARAAAGH